MHRTRKVQITLDEARRRRLDAIETLCAMEPAPAPTDLELWERDYGNLKTGLATGCTPRSQGDGVETRKRR